MSLNNIGNSYKELKQYKKAINYFNEGLKEEKLSKYRDNEIKAYLYNNLAICYLKLKKFKNINLILNKADSIFASYKIYDEQSITKIYLANYYYNTQDTLKSTKYIEESFELLKKIKAPLYNLFILNQAGFLNRSKAPKYLKEYVRISDSLF